MAQNPLQNSLKGRLVSRSERPARVKLKEPYTKGQESPSLKGRIQKIPKTAFWQRMSGWPLIEPEPEQEAIP
jgi:hypothetical protein